jgi:hypothetical protein
VHGTLKTFRAARSPGMTPALPHKRKTPALAGVSRDRPDRIDQKFMSKATSPFTPTW